MARRRRTSHTQPRKASVPSSQSPVAPSRQRRPSSTPQSPVAPSRQRHPSSTPCSLVAPSRQRRPSSTPRRHGRHAVEAQVFFDLDHAFNLIVPVVPQGFRASYERAVPKKEGILVTAEASSSRSKNKKSTRHLYTGFVLKTDDDTVMGMDTPGLPGTLIETKGNKYELCFPKIKFKMMLNYGSDEDEYVGPTKSVCQIYQMAEALQSSASMRGVSCTLWNLMTSEAEAEATRTEGDIISTCAIFGLFV
ncbi:hypothetical protein PVAP13_9NG389700 [Panicum virgatum]|uniref:Uncharacterized protein n=1 Tax=Panicum virgatum TaxID=38727 RepID=A0A8T0MSN9_PANVG|nr:hypothetical protein PVAP13_9NG389700 [Panicum virgatum]